jgi:predicted nucleic acid-binding protein
VIVVDASAIIDAIDGRRSVLDWLTGADVHAPHLLDLEVASALRRLAASGRIDQQRALDSLHLLAQAEIRRHPHLPLLPVIWSLRDRVTSYDAAYVALAAALDATLVTTDTKLAAVPGLPCAVMVP